jgi:hypothetical protein
VTLTRVVALPGLELLEKADHVRSPQSLPQGLQPLGPDLLKRSCHGSAPRPTESGSLHALPSGLQSIGTAEPADRHTSARKRLIEEKQWAGILRRRSPRWVILWAMRQATRSRRTVPDTSVRRKSRPA